MALREVSLLVLALVICSGIADARTSLQIDNEKSSSSSKISKEAVKNDQLCAMCEQFTTEATEYFKLNNTQTEISEALHQTCAKFQSFEKQCIMLVDYYAEIFFTEIGKIQPEEFCVKVSFCEGDDITMNLLRTSGFCSACQDFVTEVISNLNDSDTQMKLIVELLKGCNKVEQNYVPQCKKLVLQYSPLILVNGVKFLQNTNVCSDIHACNANQETLVSTA